MAGNAGEHARLTVEAHDWWDRHMSVRNNVKWNYLVPLLCLFRGHHRWTKWFEYGNGTESAWCDTCMKEAVRPLSDSGRTNGRGPGS